MKSSTATARAMSDAELAATSARLRREIPAAQSLFNAIKREVAKRARATRLRDNGR